MSLPSVAVDRLFQKLLMVYGSDFERMWGNLNLNDVKIFWAHELGFYAEHLECIKWALENLPDRCPNLIQFKALCKQAPRPEHKKLDYSKADAEVVDKELAKIASEALQAPKNEQGIVDHRRWAKKLAERHKNGEKLSLIQIKMCKEALEDVYD